MVHQPINFEPVTSKIISSVADIIINEYDADKSWPIFKFPNPSHSDRGSIESLQRIVNIICLDKFKVKEIDDFRRATEVLTNHVVKNIDSYSVFGISKRHSAYITYCDTPITLVSLVEYLDD